MLENIERTKAMLQRMGPDQLRQFAAAHVDDMIVMSLVSSIQKERNAAKVQQQAQQASASPPKVNQQVLESIQPADSGIAALPADNITYADGGIVGYADKGLVTSTYPGMIAQEGEGLLPSRTGYEGMGILEFIQKFGMDAYNKLKNAIPGESPDERLSRLRRETYEASPQGRHDKAMAEVNKPEPINAMALPPRPADPRWPSGADSGNAQGSERIVPPGHSPAQSITPELMDILRRDAIANGQDPDKMKLDIVTQGGRPATTDLVGVPSRKSSGTQAAYAPSADSAAYLPAAAPPAAPAANPAANQQSLIDLLKESQAATGVGKAVDPYAEERAKNAAIIKAQNEAELADAQARQTGLQKILKPKEERIAAREAALEKQMEMDKSMALITAGLAMMQTSGFGGLAAGASKGFEQYGKAMQLTKAEQQKISDARDAYDEFQYNAENMSQKEITAARGKIAAGAVAASEKSIQALMEQNSLSRADATALFKAHAEALQKAQQDEAHMARTQAEVAGRENVARINAATVGKPGERLEVMQRYQELMKVDPKQAEQYLQLYERASGITQKTTAAAGRIDAATSKILAEDMMYQSAQMTLMDPTKSQEEKAKAKRYMDAKEKTLGIAPEVAAPTITPAQAAALAKYGVK